MSDVTNVDGEVLRELPTFNPKDPADLEAWFGPFGYAENFRKVILANQREVARAKSILVNPDKPLSDARCDNAARTSDAYIDFLIETLNGRRLREQNVRDSNAASGR